MMTDDSIRTLENMLQYAQLEGKRVYWAQVTDNEEYRLCRVTNVIREFDEFDDGNTEPVAMFANGDYASLNGVQLREFLILDLDNNRMSA